VKTETSYPLRATVFCVGIGLSATGLAVALAVGGVSPAWTAVLLFASLAILAENLGVELPSGANISAGFMLQIAAVVVFREQHALLGPLLVGMSCGIYWQNLRDRDWRRVVFNIGNFGFSTLAAALIFWALPDAWTHDVVTLLFAAAAATAAFFVVNDALVALAITLTYGKSLSDVVRTFKASTYQSLPFALLGVFMGRLYLELGAVVVPLIVVPIFVARGTFASYMALKRSHDDTVRILIGALEAKDQYTAGHAERVAMFANYIGLELGLSPKRLERLRLAALMHDVGKLVVPNHLLNKPGRLTEAEFAQVRLHESVSLEILTRIDFLAPVAPSALSEFTRFTPVADEKGQPIEPHIVAVADAFDAMTSTRSYRKALAQSTAFMELRENAGKQFHPRVVDALIVAIEHRHEQYGAGHEVDVHDFAVEPPTVGIGSAGLGDLLAEESDSDAPEVTAP
jgi:HD-GYP domain-containing protein (c-di-GMP phosphodiesterase class II)